MYSKIPKSTMTSALIILCCLIFIGSCAEDDSEAYLIAPYLFIQSDTLIDIDGNVYQTVKIGDQWWMAENLRVKHYRDGSTIYEEKSDDSWQDLEYGARCSFDNDASYDPVYGLLYNWYALDDQRILAPEGWHVPSSKELQQLSDYTAENFNLRYGTANSLKQYGDMLWNESGGNNRTGFNAVPAGYRNGWHGTFRDQGYSAYFWCYDPSDSWHATYYKISGEISDDTNPKTSGHSVRCIKD